LNKNSRGIAVFIQRADGPRRRLSRKDHNVMDDGIEGLCHGFVLHGVGGFLEAPST
jgi:hypothetical protein